MIKKIFCVADIHGHYKEFIRDLEKSGYNEDDESHLLIVCGDNFDRGNESKELFNYLYRLTKENKAICLKGNHEYMLIDFLENKDSQFNYLYNGLETTIASFLEEENSFSKFLSNIKYNEDKKEVINIYGKRVKPLLEDFEAIPTEIAYSVWQEYAVEIIKKKNPELLNWLINLRDYYETKNYIFTHASIDTECKDWRNPTYSDFGWTPWQYLTWDNGLFFGKEIKNTDKTVVVGHYNTDGIRVKYNLLGADGNNSILYRDDKKIIMIDTCTPITKRVNCLIIDDEDIIGGFNEKSN